MKGYDDIEKRNHIEHLLEPYVFEEVSKFKGSVSAEHGIGQMKSPFLHLTKSQEMIKAMVKVSIKHWFT
jgi:FAD/FMN-containing dehydrogenase